jgi:hypothetical protein
MHRSWPWIFGASLLACGPQVALDEGDETGAEGGRAPTTSASASDATGPVTTLDTGVGEVDVDVDVDDGTILDDFGVRPGCIDGPPGVCLDPGPIVALDMVPRHLATGDIDGDGIDEILVSRSEDPRLLVARLAGDELVLEPHDLPAPVQSRFTVGDLDEDGRDDVATVAFQPSSILVGYGPDLVPTTTPSPIGLGSSVTYARSDTGPALLLVSMNDTVGSLDVLVPSGRATFEVAGLAADLGGELLGPNFATSVAPIPRGPGYACATNIQGPCEFSCNTELRVYAGLGTDMPATLASFDDGSPAIAVGDMQGDATADLLVANADAIARYDVQDSVVPVAVIGVPSVEALAIGDFDGDGIDDLAAGIEDTGEIWLGVAWTDTPAVEAFYPSEVAPDEIAVGDFDGNGRDDLAAVDEAGLLAVWLSRP